MPTRAHQVPWVEASASTANSEVDERTSTVEPRRNPPWGSSPANTGGTGRIAAAGTTSGLGRARPRSSTVRCARSSSPLARSRRSLCRLDIGALIPAPLRRPKSWTAWTARSGCGGPSPCAARSPDHGPRGAGQRQGAAAGQLDRRGMEHLADLSGNRAVNAERGQRRHELSHGVQRARFPCLDLPDRPVSVVAGTTHGALPLPCPAGVTRWHVAAPLTARDDIEHVFGARGRRGVSCLS